ncbi:MAG: SDR family NAD(P)-dependent oxidoreductase [Cyanobacteria bacterium P01_F01_bin.3]
MNTQHDSLSDKVCLVTGASSGVGRMSALGLAKRGAHTFIACRSKEKAQQAVDFIQHASGNSNVEYLPLDLNSLASVRRCAALFKERELPLHVLVNNAGILTGKGLSEDGFNQICSVNYFGHFLLTYLLLDRLKQADSARITLVSSDLAYKIKSIDWRLLFSGASEYLSFRRLTNSFKVYAFSKLCLLLMMNELINQLEGHQIIVNAAHPGFVRSNISPLHRLSQKLRIGVSPEEGALSSLLCATLPEAVSGQFLGPKGEEMPLPELAKDSTVARDLWERSLILVGCGAAQPATSVSKKYDGKDGIWGPFKLQRTPEDIQNTVHAVRTKVLPKPPIKLLLKSLLQSMQKRQFAPHLLNFVQLVTGQYYMERHLDSSEILSLCEDPALLKVVKDFVGSHLLLWRSEIWVNKPGQRMISFWHQDRYSNFLKGPGRRINVYLALTEVNGLNGMEYLPSSLANQPDSVSVADQEMIFIQKAGNSEFQVSPSAEQSAISVNLQPGEFVVFDEQLIHRSIENKQAKARLSMALRFVEHTVEVLPGFSPIYAPPVPLTVEDRSESPSTRQTTPQTTA